MGKTGDPLAACQEPKFPGGAIPPLPRHRGRRGSAGIWLLPRSPGAPKHCPRPGQGTGLAARAVGICPQPQGERRRPGRGGGSACPLPSLFPSFPPPWLTRRSRRRKAASAGVTAPARRSPGAAPRPLRAGGSGRALPLRDASPRSPQNSSAGGAAATDLSRASLASLPSRPRCPSAPPAPGAHSRDASLRAAALPPCPASPGRPPRPGPGCACAPPPPASAAAAPPR